MKKRTDEKRGNKNYRNEIIIAVIGLIGVLSTAVFSNWEKIFPSKNVIKAEYTGYRPTDNFETTLRYYFDVSGTRSTLEGTQQQMINSLKMQLISQYPNEAEQINKILDASLKEAITLDEVIKKLLPVYRKHFTIEELHELNKFYSTEVMQNMTKKLPIMTQEMAPLQTELLLDFQDRYQKRLTEIID